MFNTPYTHTHSRKQKDKHTYAKQIFFVDLIAIVNISINICILTMQLNKHTLRDRETHLRESLAKVNMWQQEKYVRCWDSKKQIV